MDQTTYTVLNAVKEYGPINYIDLLNKLVGRINVSIASNAVQYCHDQKWVLYKSPADHNPMVEITYLGLRTLWEAEEDEKRYQENRLLLEQANTISLDANKISEQANTYAKEANSISKKANSFAKMSIVVSAAVGLAEIIRNGKWLSEQAAECFQWLSRMHT